MKQKSVHRLVYKIESKTLKQNKWSLFLPVSKAMKECPDNIISLNDSQCLRFIDEINGSDDTKCTNLVYLLLKGHVLTFFILSA